MDVFSEENKQQVLDTLFKIATDHKSASVPAIKLYLELADEQTPEDTLTTEQALEILREASTPPSESPPPSAGVPAPPESE